MSNQAKQVVRQVVPANAATIQAVVMAMNDAATEVVSAADAFASTKGRQLPLLMLQLTNVAKVTDDAWVKDWAPVALPAYIESGRYTVDAKGKSLSALSAVSSLKVCVIALTHGYTPEEGESLYAFTKSARTYCHTSGLVAATGTGRKPGKDEDKAAQGDAVAAARVQAKASAKAAQPLALDALGYATGLTNEVFGEPDAKLARDLCNLLTDDDAIVAFEEWFEAYVAAKAAKRPRRRAA